jgi:hypothetical protein
VVNAKKIAGIIHDHFNPPPAERAAKELFSLGVRDKDMDLKAICSKPPYPGTPQALAVWNALRDMERNTR